MKPVGAETLSESPQCAGADRLRTVESDAPGAQVEPAELAVVDALEAQLEAEVRSRRDGSTVVVDGPQPADRPGKEGRGRHEDQRRAEVEAPEPGSDQPHVVIEGKPAHEDVVRGDARRLAHGPDARQEVAVGQDHPLREAGGPRGVLQQRDVRSGSLPHGRLARRGPHQVPGVDQPAQAWHPQPQEASGTACLGDRHEQASPGIVQDRSLPQEVLLDVGGPRGRVDGNRHAAGEQRPEEGNEVIPARGKHERDAVARIETVVEKLAGRRPCRPCQLPVG